MWGWVVEEEDKEERAVDRHSLATSVGFTGPHACRGESPFPGYSAPGLGLGGEQAVGGRGWSIEVCRNTLLSEGGAAERGQPWLLHAYRVVHACSHYSGNT